MLLVPAVPLESVLGVVDIALVDTVRINGKKVYTVLPSDLDRMLKLVAQTEGPTGTAVTTAAPPPTATPTGTPRATRRTPSAPVPATNIETSNDLGDSLRPRRVVRPAASTTRVLRSAMSRL